MMEPKEANNIGAGNVKDIMEKKQIREPCRHYILLPTDDDVTGDCQLGEDLDCVVCPYYDSNRMPYDLDLNDVYDSDLDNEPHEQANENLEDLRENRQAAQAQGRTIREIATSLSMSRSAVKERLRRARKGDAAEK